MPEAPAQLSDIENPLALEQQVCFALAVASRTVISVYRPLLEPLGLTHPQYLVLLQLDPGTLSRLLKRLESAELVRRTRDRRDERSLAVVLTGRGKALREEAREIPPAIVERLGLDLSELLDLHTRLTAVIAAAKAATGPDRS